MRAFTCSTGSPFDGSIVSVAPSCFAVLRFSSCGSIAMMRPAPAMRAPWITAWPTPPQPRTATLAPGLTFAVLSAAPTPVVTPQPMSAALSSGTRVSMGTAWLSLTTVRSTNTDVLAKE